MIGGWSGVQKEIRGVRTSRNSNSNNSNNSNIEVASNNNHSETITLAFFVSWNIFRGQVA